MTHIKSKKTASLHLSSPVCLSDDIEEFALGNFIKRDGDTDVGSFAVGNCTVSAYQLSIDYIDFNAKKIFFADATPEQMKQIVNGLAFSIVAAENNDGNKQNFDYNCIVDDVFPDEKSISASGLTLSSLNPAFEKVLWFPAKPELGNTLISKNSLAIGDSCIVSQKDSLAVGDGCIAGGKYSVAIGRENSAGYAAFAEGQQTSAFGLYSHTEGFRTKVVGTDHWGWDSFSGRAGHAAGVDAITKHKYAWTWSGKEDKSKSYESKGIGTFNINPKDGVNGVYIGEQTLSSIISTALSSKVDKCSDTCSSDFSNSIVNGLANIAYADYCVAEGLSNVAGSRAHRILSGCIEDKKFYLNSVEGLSSGMLYSCRIYRNKDNFGTIQSVDENEKSIVVDSIPERPSLRFHHPVYGSEFYIVDKDGAYIAASEITGSYPASDPYPASAGYKSIISAYGSLQPGEQSEAGTSKYIMSMWYALNPEVGEFSLGEAAWVHGSQNIANTLNSHAEGTNCIASGKHAHAEGIGSFAGYADHAEGWETSCFGLYSHTEGRQTHVGPDMYYSHAEGSNTIVNSNASHAEGSDTVVDGSSSHAEGRQTHVGSNAEAAHAEGLRAKVLKSFAHAEGRDCTANGFFSHAEGLSTVANANAAHAEGEFTIANGTNSHSEGRYTKADGTEAHSAGWLAYAKGDMTMALGRTATTCRRTSPDITSTLAVNIGDYVKLQDGKWTKCEPTDDALSVTTDNLNFNLNMSRSTVFDFAYRADSNAVYKLTTAGNLTSYQNQSELKYDNYAYVWSGINSSSKPYASHGESTYNINPKDGISGFYVGNSSLCAILDNALTNAPINGKLTEFEYSATLSIQTANDGIQTANASISKANDDIANLSRKSVDLCAANQTTDYNVHQLNTITNKLFGNNNYIFPYNAVLKDITNQFLASADIAPYLHTGNYFNRTNGTMTSFGSGNCIGPIPVEMLDGYYIWSRSKNGIALAVLSDETGYVGFDGVPIGTFDTTVDYYTFYSINSEYLKKKFPKKNIKYIGLSWYNSQIKIYAKQNELEFDNYLSVTNMPTGSVFMLSTLITPTYNPPKPVGYAGNVLYGKKYVAFGDSYTGTNSTAVSGYYPNVIGERNGMTVANKGVGGAIIRSDPNDQEHTEHNRYKLVDHINELSTDIKNADYVTLMFGINDQKTSYDALKFGELDSSDKTTIYGAWNVVLSSILSVNPGVKLGIIVDDYNTKDEIITAWKNVGKYWGIPCLDLRSDPNVPLLIGGKTYSSEMNPFAIKQRNLAFKNADPDIHPSIAGHQYRSTIIENFLRSL